MLAIFLTVVVVSGQPHTLNFEKIRESVKLLSENPIQILVGVFILSILRGVCGIFILKTKIIAC